MTSIGKCLLAIGVLIAAPGLARESLVDVYQRALHYDPTIREAEATYLAAAEAKPQARAGLLPALSFGASRAHRFQDTNGGAIDPISGSIAVALGALALGSLRRRGGRR